MALPLDRKAYADCYEIFDRALASKKGVRVFRDTIEATTYLRNRLNKARALDKELNRRVYQPDHPLHGSSEYYKVSVRLSFVEEKGRWACELTKNDFTEADIEEIEPWGEEAHERIVADLAEFDLAEDQEIP